MPALLTRASSRFHRSSAAAARARPPAAVATSYPSASACPPAARSSSTTARAGAGDGPCPSVAVPTSLTRTCAPRVARRTAYCLPSPRPPAGHHDDAAVETDLVTPLVHRVTHPS
jgi:hypothetical protein